VLVFFVLRDSNLIRLLVKTKWQKGF